MDDIVGAFTAAEKEVCNNSAKYWIPELQVASIYLMCGLGKRASARLCLAFWVNPVIFRTIRL